MTHCTADIISPFVEAILAIYRIHYNNERLKSLQATPNTPINTTTGHSLILCDSPDSGIVSCTDTKSMRSDTDNEEDCCVVGISMDINNNMHNCIHQDDEEEDSEDDDDDEEEDEPYHCLEYPKMAKRRRLF